MRKTDLWTPNNQPQFSRRSLLLGGIGIGTIGVLTACSSDTTPSNDASADGSGELISLSAGVLPIVDVAAIYIASTQCIFQDHELDIDVTVAQGGAVVVPGVIAGDFMFGFSNLTSLLIARSHGLNLKTVAPGSGSNGQVGADYFGLFVAGDSEIQNGADLSGHSIAVNTVRNINDSTIKAGLEDAGGDPDSETFIEVGFPDMPATLENGQVDAIAVAEPFLTQVLDNGGRDDGGSTTSQQWSPMLTIPTPVVAEEVFGTVITIQPFDTEEEAISRANATEYGLAAGVQTSDVKRAHRVFKAIQAGLV